MADLATPKTPRARPVRVLPDQLFVDPRHERLLPQELFLLPPDGGVGSGSGIRRGDHRNSDRTAIGWGPDATGAAAAPLDAPRRRRAADSALTATVQPPSTRASPPVRTRRGDTDRLKPTTERWSEGRHGESALRPRLDGTPRVGTVLDKYRLDAVLGTGGFAIVYQATHLLLQVQVAIKLVRPEVLAARADQAQRLVEEARFAARLDHPNIVRVHDVTHDERITYIVMEYVDGPSLAEALVRTGPLPPRSVVRLGLDAAEGLRAALAQGLIHRDVKPGNLLLTRTGVAKVADLGLARSTGDGGSSEVEIVGTPCYLAPELAIDPERADFRADLYALGLTLYEAATLDRPFEGADPVETIARQVRDPLPDPCRKMPGFPEDLARVLRWCMAKDPAMRPASYDQLIDALRQLDHSLAARETPDQRRSSRGGLMDRLRTIFTAPRPPGRGE